MSAKAELETSFEDRETARGISAGAIMAKAFGKATGCSRGRCGSMHFFDASRNFFGRNAIVGGSLPLADEMRRRKNVAATFFGDGAVAKGEFHESMNLAALWKLPVLFICDNNLYAMGTALAFAEAGELEPVSDLLRDVYTPR